MAKELSTTHSDKGWRNIVLLLVLMLGILIGGLAATYLVYPAINADSIQTISDLSNKNLVVEKEAQTYLQCLNVKGIDPQTCPVVR